MERDWRNRPIAAVLVILIATVGFNIPLPWNIRYVVHAAVIALVVWLLWPTVGPAIRRKWSPPPPRS